MFSMGVRFERYSFREENNFIPLYHINQWVLCVFLLLLLTIWKLFISVNSLDTMKLFHAHECSATVLKVVTGVETGKVTGDLYGIGRIFFPYCFVLWLICVRLSGCSPFLRYSRAHGFSLSFPPFLPLFFSACVFMSWIKISRQESKSRDDGCWGNGFW